MPLVVQPLEDRARVYKGAVLALDLGAHTGWACRHIDGAIRSGTVTFDVRGGAGFRWLRFRAWLTEFKNAAGGLDMVWWERIDFLGPRPSVENSRTKYGFEATLTCWCEHHGIPYPQALPSQIKKFATGNGNATKKEVMDAMRQSGFHPKDDNEADALALLGLALERTECGRAA